MLLDKVIQFRADASLDQQIDELSELRKKNRSEFIREAIQEHILKVRELALDDLRNENKEMELKILRNREKMLELLEMQSEQIPA